MAVREKKKSKQATKAKKGNKSHSVVEEFRYGQSISVDFFRANAWILMVIVVVVLALMGLRYKTKTRMTEIQTLTAELSRAESRMLTEKSAYMSLIRETEMRRMVHEHGLPLEFQEQPPYHLSTTIDKK